MRLALRARSVADIISKFLDQSRKIVYPRYPLEQDVFICQSVPVAMETGPTLVILVYAPSVKRDGDVLIADKFLQSSLGASVARSKDYRFVLQSTSKSG